MVYVNYASVLIWILCLVLLRKGYRTPSFLLGYLEVIIHSSLCILYFGWRFGAQFFLIPALAGVFLVPIRRRYQLALVLILATVFVGMQHFAAIHSPLFPVDDFNLNLLNTVNILVGCFGLTALISMFYVHIAETAEVALESEHERSEQLLRSIMPESIATRLKSSETVADRLEESTILFADIVNFSKLSQTLAPGALLEVLNAVFSPLDDMVDQYGLEKIKTIGDAYMVAAGVPEHRKDHAEQMAHFALEMQVYLRRRSREIGIPLQMRIGIHSGSVIAGVIGHKRFQYDLWGDTVNTASRMESHGIPSEIQVTEETAKLLEGKFLLEPRGELEIKGKGLMRTWLLKGLTSNQAD